MKNIIISKLKNSISASISDKKGRKNYTFTYNKKENPLAAESFSINKVFYNQLMDAIDVYNRKNQLDDR